MTLYNLTRKTARPLCPGMGIPGHSDIAAWARIQAQACLDSMPPPTPRHHCDDACDPCVLHTEAGSNHVGCQYNISTTPPYDKEARTWVVGEEKERKGTKKKKVQHAYTQSRDLLFQAGSLRSWPFEMDARVYGHLCG